MEKKEVFSVEDILTKARVQMLSKQPFWGTLVMHLTFQKLELSEKVKEKIDKEIKEEKHRKMVLEHYYTMGVDEWGNVHYNPHFIKALSLEEVKACLAHEVMHLGLEHLNRRGTRSRLKWNIAADFGVNLLIKNDFKLPKFVLLDDKYKNMSVEQIYDKLPKPKKCPYDCNKCPFKEGSSCGGLGDYVCRKRGSWDEHIEEGDKSKENEEKGEGKGKGKDKTRIGQDVSDANASKKKPNWRQVFVDAYQTAKSRGNVPVGMDRLFDEFFAPQVNWRQLLSRYINFSVPKDFTYRRPHKKSIVSGYFIPDITKEQLNVIFAIDTSGSMDKHELTEGMSEALGILKTFRSVKITLMACDTKVYNVQEVTTEVDLRRYQMKGYGGTDFRPVFKWVKENEPRAQLLIYFTDLDGYMPLINEIPSRLNTIWIVSEQGLKKDAPFGLTIHLRGVTKRDNWD